MGTRYQQLTLAERCELARLQAEGCSYRQIAAALDRAPSTITREVKRNGSSRQRGYQPAYADQQARARRWQGSKLERDAALREWVLARLKAGWSPQQVCGRLKRETGRTILSYETIYRFIDAQIRRGKAYDWRHYLPQGKTRRGWTKRGSPAVAFPTGRDWKPGRRTWRPGRRPGIGKRT